MSQPFSKSPQQASQHLPRCQQYAFCAHTWFILLALRYMPKRPDRNNHKIQTTSSLPECEAFGIFVVFRTSGCPVGEGWRGGVYQSSKDTNTHATVSRSSAPDLTRAHRRHKTTKCEAAESSQPLHPQIAYVGGCAVLFGVGQCERVSELAGCPPEARAPEMALLHRMRERKEMRRTQLKVSALAHTLPDLTLSCIRAGDVKNAIAGTIGHEPATHLTSHAPYQTRSGLALRS